MTWVDWTHPKTVFSRWDFLFVVVRIQNQRVFNQEAQGLDFDNFLMVPNDFLRLRAFPKGS